MSRLEAKATNREFLIADPTAEPLTLEAAAGEGSESKTRRFAMTAYTGGKLMAGSYYPYGVVVDLTGLSVTAKSRPILRDHDTSQIVGHTTDVTIGDAAIRLKGELSGANEYAAEVEASADKGFPWQASIGALPTQVAFVDRGESVTVNGKKFTGPIYVARKASLREVSFVALGADDSTAARLLASAERKFEMDFETWLAAKGFEDSETLTAASRTFLQAQFDAEIAAADDDQAPGGNGRGTQRRKSGKKATKAPLRATGNVDDEDDEPINAAAQYREQVAAESDRVSAIRAKIAEYGVTTIDIKGTEQNLESHAIRAGWTVEQLELHALRASRGTGPAIHSHTNELTANPLEAALLASIGVDQSFLGKHFDEKTVNASLERKYRGASLHMLMDAVIHAAGKHFSGNRKSEDFIEAALTADRAIRASGFSTVSLSGLLGNVANKILLSSYEAVEVAWPLFTAVRSHSDFKAVSRYRLDSSGAFKKVGPDGELKHAGLTEGSYSAQLDTYGVMLALTRQMQINDDLDAFANLPRVIGQMGATRMEEAVFALLLANTGSFFHANNANLLTGAGSALGVAGYTAAEAAFANQVDSNGKPIGVSPSVLLTGSTLAVTADNLAKQTKLEATGSTDAAVFVNNPHSGKFSVAKSPYVNNIAIRDQDGLALTGQSSTAWYLFANPMVRAAITIAFLNGRRVPTVQFAESDFNTLGMQWRGFHDFGVAFEDPKAGQRNAGA